MFVDNCAAHPDVQLSNVKLVFLPPNTTSRLQPCDAGIIAAMKAHYRKRLMRHVLAEMDNARTAAELSKKVNLLDAINWVHHAWASVTESAVSKCFAKCGFATNADTVPVDGGDGEVPQPDGEVLQPDGEAYAELLGTVSWAAYVAMDETASTTDVTGDDWEAALVDRAKGEKLSEDESEDDADEPGMADDEPPVISTKVAVAHVRDLLTFAMQSANKSMIDGIVDVQAMVEEHSVRLAAAAKQKCITDFFRK